MGCLSSKFITKSLSFREDLSHKNRGANGLTLLDELFTSDVANGLSNDHQFFTLVSKLQTGDVSEPPKKSLELKNEEMINTWELMAGLEDQTEQKQDVIELVSSKVVDHDNLKRSKSCELYTFGLNQDDKGIGRSRSFHTVEEYDAMMARIMSSSDEYDHYFNNDMTKFQETTQSVSRNQYKKKKANTLEPDIKEVIPILDTGFKRKALAKGLESLQIPSAASAEFRKTGSLKDWLENGGNFSSPGEYVTPKFGNYNKLKSGLSEESRDDIVFNPELVAAFEEFLQQLEVEEDSILEQIEGNHNEITATE